MRIGGEVALSLPEADTATVWLTMSPLERQLYDKAVNYSPFLSSYLQHGAKASTLEMSMGARRSACSNTYTKSSAFSKLHPSRSSLPCKHRFLAVSGPFTQADVESICKFEDLPTDFDRIRGIHQPYSVFLHREYTADPSKCTKLSALRDDLIALRTKDASMHAVVFTHVAVTHLSIVAMLRLSGFHVCEFSGATKIEDRHQTIRDFQASGEARKKEAKVFVITMKTGAVGITLTAATRVYLMEPSLDPAMEVQAAGRIHRLGRTSASGLDPLPDLGQITLPCLLCLLLTQSLSPDAVLHCRGQGRAHQALCLPRLPRGQHLRAARRDEEGAVVRRRCDRWHAAGRGDSHPRPQGVWCVIGHQRQGQGLLGFRLSLLLLTVARQCNDAL